MVSIEYVINGDIKELASIRAVAGKDTASAPPTEIILGEGLRVERVLSGPSCDESFIGGGGGLERYTISSSFFGTNSRRREFSSIKFNRAEDKTSISRLNMLFDDSIYFMFFFEFKSSFARSNSSLRESISLGSDEFIWAGSSSSPPTTFESWNS
ncbi:5194_t:CDS:1 [Ambispora gerdemannii]|uniref:5194_t:CDS:1 n=1 Tax=Ambispora gerdemannii TaxID=144530 RepID=A0A9N9AKL2_9GLOM|nr:5194_t:CDS:1 [Ambispora gerdemannii]